MRSKEVENNINLLITYRGNLWQQHKNPKIAKAIDETIDYISEKEKENKFLRDENNIYKNETVSKSVIRDKIKELEENRDKYVEENKFGSYMEVEGKIEVLKELLEGE